MLQDLCCVLLQHTRCLLTITTTLFSQGCSLAAPLASVTKRCCVQSFHVCDWSKGPFLSIMQSQQYFRSSYLGILYETVKLAVQVVVNKYSWIFSCSKKGFLVLKRSTRKECVFLKGAFRSVKTWKKNLKGKEWLTCIRGKESSFTAGKEAAPAKKPFEVFVQAGISESSGF